VLYIEGSPRKHRSASIEVARAALAAWKEVDSSLTIDVFDVWSEELPEFNGHAMEAKYAGIAGTQLSEEQLSAWGAIRKLTDRFHAADALVIGSPLWNFGVPYRMKQLIDVVSQKDLLFSFDGRGLNGLLSGKRALLVCARGLDYAANCTTPAERYDFQKPYLEAWLRFIGISEIALVVVEKTLFGAEMDTAARAEAKKQAADVVREYANDIGRGRSRRLGARA
jgi:FMN-dependent NADH-azoreductase